METFSKIGVQFLKCADKGIEINISSFKQIFHMYHFYPQYVNLGKR